MKKLISYIFNIIWKDLTIFGSLVFYLFLIGLFFGLKEYKFAIKLVLGLFFSYIITIFIRSIYYKQRPDKQKYNNFLEKIDSSSFPSMHTMRISIVFFLSWFEMTNLVLSGLFFILLIIVAISRFILKRHYLSDIIVGFLIGATLAVILGNYIIL